MKKHFKKLWAIVVATGLMASMTCTSVSAEDIVPEPEGYVTFAVEKFSIGQGYIVEPWRVPVREYEQMGGIEFLRYAVHGTSLNTTTTGENVYVWGFTDTDTGEVNLPDCLDGVVDKESLIERADEKYLSEGDYTAESGFVFFLNGEPAPFGISDYEAQVDDVVRFSFTVYNYGADVGCDNSSWGGSKSLIGDVNRDEATTWIAKIKELKQKLGYAPDISKQMAVICDLDSTQDEIDAVCDELEDIYNEGNKPADTGFAVGMLMPALIGTCAIVSKKKSKN